MINCFAKSFIIVKFIARVTGAVVALLNLLSTFDVVTELGAGTWRVAFVSVHTCAAVIP